MVRDGAQALLGGPSCAPLGLLAHKLDHLPRCLAGDSVGTSHERNKMQRTLNLAAIVTFVASLAAVAHAAPALDAKGKCRDGGKFVAASMCKAPAPAGGKCRDIKSKKFAKCGAPNTEPVPAKK